MKNLFGIYKGLDKMERISMKVKVLAGILLAVSAIWLVGVYSYSESVNKGLSESLIRLHVIANSDSPEDQQIKRDVRDALLAYMQSLVKDSVSAEETRLIIQNNMEGITAIASETIRSKGKNYGVEAVLDNCYFPTKTYGDIALPAGKYQALKVIIGKGEGSNWWCVLFPPLCFVDVTHGTVPDQVKDDLKEVLTEEEYNLIASSDEKSDIPVKIKFKIVEILQDSKVKLAGAIDRLLKPQG